MSLGSHKQITAVSTTCWYTHASKRPKRLDLSSLTSHKSRSPTVARTALVSLNVMLKIFPRLFTGHSDKVGIIVPYCKIGKLSVVLPFFMTNELDLAGLDFILALAVSFSRLRRIHQLPITDVVVTVRSSIYALAHSCLHHWSPTLDLSRFHKHIYGQGEEGSWERTTNNDTPLLSLCRSKIIILEEILILKLS